MKILQLCKKFPFPLRDGESIAITSLSRSLTQLGVEVHLLAMNTTRHYYKLQGIPTALQHYRAIEAVDLDNRIKYSDAFWNLFSRESYHISRFVSKDFERRLVTLLESNPFDVIQLETLYLAPYIPVIRKWSNALISMRAHNVEHEIWMRICRQTKNVLKAEYLRYLTRKLKRFEVVSLQHYDMLVAISQRDLEQFRSLGYQGAAIVTPVGLDMHSYKTSNNGLGSLNQPLSIGFIGSLDWMPNQEGLLWFLEQVWPQVHQKWPKLELHVAGRNTPEWLFHRNWPQVTIHGEVEDAVQFTRQHTIMLVPLLSGSGLRVKILEAMAVGKVVLTTHIGLEGIKAEHGVDVLIADTSEEFLGVLQTCMNDREMLFRIGRNARAMVLQAYNDQAISRELVNSYHHLLTNHQ